MTGADIAAEARQWLGVRWRHQGRTAGGVDCIGLVVKVAHGLQLSAFDVSNYGPLSTDETLRDGCREHLQEVRLTDMRPGDVVVMRFGPQRHIGILGDYPAGGLSLIHAYTQARKVVEVRLGPEWRGRIMAAFRFPGIEP